MLTRGTEAPERATALSPDSIVFTPDKNRTWAESFGLPALQGHSKGSETAREIIRACFDLGIRDVVFWAMSESNIYKRSPLEREHLVQLLKSELRRQEKEDEQYGFHLCGRWQKIVKDPELEDLVARAHERTAGFRRQRLTVLFGYRGMTDILQAAARVAEKFGPEAVENQDLVRTHMWIGHLPEKVDMMVRTGVSEHNRHNSDSLLPLHGEQAFVWDVAEYWPRFSTKLLHLGVEHFARCKRAKGA